MFCGKSLLVRIYNTLLPSMAVLCGFIEPDFTLYTHIYIRREVRMCEAVDHN